MNGSIAIGSRRTTPTAPVAAAVVSLRQGGAQEDAVLPVPGLGDQRDRGLAAAAEDDGVDRHARPGRRSPRTGSGTAGSACRTGCSGGGRAPSHPRASSRCPASRPGAAAVTSADALPPDVAVVGQRDVGEERVAAVDGPHRVRVGRPAGARRDAEQPALRVGRVQPAVRRRTASRRCRRRASRPVQPGTVGSIMARFVLPQALGKAAAMWYARPSGEISLRISMCSASQPSSRPITEAIRSE